MRKLDNLKLAFTFDDVALIPQHSNVRSRKDPSVETTLAGFDYGIPVVSAPMNTVTGVSMVSEMARCEGLGILHRFMTIEEQCSAMRDIATNTMSVDRAAAVGCSGDYLERTKALFDAGCFIFCVDVANGHNVLALEAVENIKKIHSDIVVMAGNVCTFEGAWSLVQAGAEIIRVGIGPGAMCKTRVVTGHGVPQLSAIEDCAQIKFEYPNISIVADGGIRGSGDAIKALAVGADAVMIGSLLAATDESPGFVINGKKLYAGMASKEGRELWYDRAQTSTTEEGESTLVDCKGPVKNVLANLVNGIKVGMSYAGAHDLASLRQKAQFVRVTPNGYREGTPHGKGK